MSLLYYLSKIAYRLLLLVPSCPARARGTRISRFLSRLLLLGIIDSCCWVYALSWLDTLQCTRGRRVLVRGGASIMLCSRSTHSLIFDMSLCVHFPSFGKCHSSCHLLKRVSLAFPRMMFLSSSGKCPCLRLYCSCSTRIFYISKSSNLMGGISESTVAASLDSVRDPLMMSKFILRCTVPICLSTKYAGVQSDQEDAPYSRIYSTTVTSNCLRAGHGPSTLGISRISDVHAIDAFVVACFTWCLNDHFLSSYTPKYFISYLRGTTSPLISNQGALYSFNVLPRLPHI